MIETDLKAELTKKAVENFHNIKSSLKGLYEILVLSNPDNFCYKLEFDNIIELYQNLLELLSNDTGANEVMKKLKKSKIERELRLKDLRQYDSTQMIEKERNSLKQ